MFTDNKFVTIVGPEVTDEQLDTVGRVVSGPRFVKVSGFAWTPVACRRASDFDDLERFVEKFERNVWWNDEDMNFPVVRFGAPHPHVFF